MRPPPRPNNAQIASATGRAQSPAESIVSVNGTRPRSPSATPNAGTKRKERDYEQDAGEETNINVVVRCRGRSEREVRENSGVVVSTNGVKGQNVELSMGPNALSNKTYHFDKVFSPAADQAIIFDDVVTPILEEMLAGYNCTIFAYGQTGTGKTYTMSGDMADTLGLLSDAAGIIPRVLYWLFQRLETDQIECSVKCSFIELYNEELRDLLSIDDNVKLKIYDDASKKGHSATMVQGMEESHIKTAGAGIRLLQTGSYRRQVAATKCNDLSSRSHTVFTITTYIKKAGDSGEDFICAGKLNLVDLAGSENIQRSGAENKRAAEAGLINKSLLTLGRVINALVDKGSHIPYRESKLTRLLQDSLGGRTKTCIIATVSPAKSNLEETISTLDYAFRAKNIRNKPQINSMISKKTLLKEFTAEIEKLKSELIATRQRNGVYLSNEQFEEITVESESRRILTEEQRARIETMEVSLRNKVQELFSLTNSFNILKRDNEATRSLLENTKDVLLKTEIVLHDTRQNLADETALREAHQRTERELHGLGSGLISTLGETVQDLGGLHAGLRRRSELHAVNRQAWESSASHVVDVSRIIDDRVDTFRSEHSGMLAALSERTNQYVSAELQKLKDNQDFLHARIGEYDSAERKLQEQTSVARGEMNDVLEEIKILREDVKAKVGEGLQGLSTAAEKISGEVIAELDQFHTQLHTSYSTLGRDFKCMFEDITKQLITQKAEADRLRAELEEANQQNIESSKEACSRIQSCLEKEQTTAQEDRQALLSQISKLIESSGSKQDQRISSALNATQTHLAESRSAFEAANAKYSDGMKKWMENDAALVSQVNNSRDNLKSKMKKDWTVRYKLHFVVRQILTVTQDVNTRNASIQTSTKAVHQETVNIVDAQLNDMAIQMAALDEFVTRARSQNDQQQTAHAESLRGLSSNLHQTCTSLGQRLDSASANLSTFGTENAAEISNLQENLGPLTEELHQSLAQLQSDIQSTRLQDYTPTGETPQKKDWAYPTTLPQTEDHESVIAKRRGLPDPKQQALTDAARTPGRSPRKIASPRKHGSPTKPSPSKGKIYTDVGLETGNGHSHHTASATNAGTGGGLKEIDMNIVQTTGQRPVSADGLLPAEFSKSVGSGVQQPPLKKHATAGIEGSRLPKLGPNGSRSGGRVKADGWEKENHTINVLSQSVGAGSGHGRRLRSSPQQ
jgi:kinesin family member 11